jgi:hypothetical protein
LRGGGCTGCMGVAVSDTGARPAQAGRSPPTARRSMALRQPATATRAARFPLPTNRLRRVAGGHVSGLGSISGGCSGGVSSV